MSYSGDLRILEVGTCESTQSLLGDYSQEFPDHAAIVISDEQTKGKGQRGNQWISPKGKGWYFSFYLPHLQIPIINAKFINWVVSLKLIQALSHHKVTALAKWPNDIYTKRGKLAGTLVENQVHNRQIKSAAIGIGINTSPIDFNKNPLGITSLEDEVDQIVNPIERNTFILGLVKEVYQQLQLPLVNLNHWRAEILKYSYGMNRLFTFEKEGIRFDARVKTIDEQGLLVLETNQGEMKATSGSIKWIKHV